MVLLGFSFQNKSHKIFSHLERISAIKRLEISLAARATGVSKEAPTGYAVECKIVKTLSRILLSTNVPTKKPMLLAVNPKTEIWLSGNLSRYL